MKFVFSPDIILSGWLVSKHQPINYTPSTMACARVINFLVHCFILHSILDALYASILTRKMTEPSENCASWWNRWWASCMPSVCDLQRITHTLMFDRKFMTENVSFNAILTGSLYSYNWKDNCPQKYIQMYILAFFCS